MSSTAQAGPSAPKEKKGLGKVLSRMKTVLRRGDGSKRSSMIPAAGVVSTGEAAASSSAPAEQAQQPKAPAKLYIPEGATAVPRSQIYEERAKKLGERFGFEIKLTEWQGVGDAVRMEKPIRMRVHHRCHVCQHVFGSAKECPSCKHPKCKQCERHPPRRTEAEKIESRKRRAAILKEQAENRPIVPDWDLSGNRKVVLTRPRKGGPDLEHRKPRQRVRRTCCECKMLYKAGNKTCDGCQHKRCTDCPRDPAKKDKYPYGYPGDEFGKNSVPHYACHECKTVYTPNPEEAAECTKCNHKRCATCPRMKPAKVEPEPDPELWKVVQQKLESLRVE